METSPALSLAQFINMPELLDRIGNDHEFLRELFELFRSKFPALHIKLQQAVGEKDMQQTAKAAHMLKGMLANLSMDRAAAAVGELEEMAAAEDQPGTESTLAIFDKEVVGLLPALDGWLAETRP